MKRSAVVALVCVALLLPACAPWARTHPAAAAVARALDLRSARSTDASAFAEVFADPAIAAALASEPATSSADPLPKHDEPYVSALATSTADVVVVWHPAPAQRDWPGYTVFKVRLLDGAWRIADALPNESTSAPQPLPRP